MAANGVNGANGSVRKHHNEGTFLFTVSALLVGFWVSLLLTASLSLSLSVRVTPTKSPIKSRMPS